MSKYLIRTIFSKSPFLRKSIFRFERWLREDLYSGMSQEQFQHFIALLTPITNSSIQFSRKGSKHDGGYVICQLNKKYTNLISFGVGDNVDFEYEMSSCVEALDLYDPTVNALPRAITNATFKKVGLGSIGAEGYITLLEATRKFLPSDKLLLKIDIEGGEWDSIYETDVELLKSFSQIFLELHNLHDIHISPILTKYITVLEKLLQNHSLVYIHANNWSSYFVVNGVPLPDTIEITLLRKDEVLESQQSNVASTQRFNSPNNPLRPDYCLIF